MTSTFLPGPLLPDAAFDNDGQLTKLPLRFMALVALAPAPGQVLWDVGVGSGSIGISWCRAATGARAIGFEKRSDRAERALMNATALGVRERFEVHIGDADELAREVSLPQPDAIFFGGGAGRDAVAHALRVLPVGGRLVIHSVTLETDALVTELHATLGGDLQRISMETAHPLGAFRGWRPARCVTCYALTKN